MTKLKNLWNNKYFWTLLALSAMSGLNAQEHTADSNAEFIKTVTTPGPRVNIDSLKNLGFDEAIEYHKKARRQPTHVQIDTIRIDGNSNVPMYGALHNSTYNTIVLNWYLIDSAYRVGLETAKDANELFKIGILKIQNDGLEETFIHEKKHADDERDYRPFIMTTPEQMVQYNIHVEIAARIATLINYNRTKWLKTKDIHRAFPSNYAPKRADLDKSEISRFYPLNWSNPLGENFDFSGTSKDPQLYISYIMEHPDIGVTPDAEEAQIIWRTAMQMLGTDDVSQTYKRQFTNNAKFQIEASVRETTAELVSDTIVRDTDFDALVHKLYDFQANDGTKFNILQLGGAATINYMKTVIRKWMGSQEIKNEISEIKNTFKPELKYTKATHRLLSKKPNKKQLLDISEKNFFSRD